MFTEQRKRYFPLPEYDLSDPNHVLVTIYGKLIDENYSRILIEKEDLTLPEVISLDRIQKRQEVSDEALQALRKKKLIEGRRPNIFVAAHIAATSNKRAEYIKNRAFDDDHYQQMILKFLDKYSTATRQELNDLIADKLPAVLNTTQKNNKISNLLGKMKRDGLIENQGSDRKPKWARKRASVL